MNKAELVQALAERLDGDRKVATDAVDGLLDVIVRTVHAGDSVSVIGFGVFEARERAARSARNPRTGQLIDIPATTVPAFRPGAMFRDVVSGARPLGEVAQGSAPARSTATRQVTAPKPAANPAPVPAVDVTPSAVEAAAADSAPASKPARPAAKQRQAKVAAKAPAKPAKGAKAEKPAKGAKAEKTAKETKAKDGKKKAKK